MEAPAPRTTPRGPAGPAAATAAGSIARSRPRRSVRRARTSGQALALKHVEACTKAYDEEYGDDWGPKKRGKPVYTVKARRRFIKNAYETLCDEIRNAPEFYADEEIAWKAMCVLRDGCLRSFPGSDAMQDADHTLICRMSEDALVGMLRSRCHSAVPGWEKGDIVADLESILLRRMTEVAERGHHANGSTVTKRDSTKPKLLRRIGEAVGDLMIFCEDASDFMTVTCVMAILGILRNVKQRISAKDLSSVPKSTELSPGVTVKDLEEDIDECIATELRLSGPGADASDEDDASDGGGDGSDCDYECDDDDGEDDESDFRDCVSDEEDEDEEIERGRQIDRELEGDLATDDDGGDFSDDEGETDYESD